MVSSGCLLIFDKYFRVIWFFTESSEHYLFNQLVENVKMDDLWNDDNFGSLDRFPV